MFPDDFFGNQDSKTSNFTKKSEHPKLLNPQIIPQKKSNEIHVIKEELLEESTEAPFPKKNGLKIIIPQDSSNEDNSTTESSKNTPLTPVITNYNYFYDTFKAIPYSIIDCKTSTNSLKDNELTRPIIIKEKNKLEENQKNEKNKGKMRSVSNRKPKNEKIEKIEKSEKSNNEVISKNSSSRNKSENRYLKNKQNKNNNVIRANKRTNTVEIKNKKEVNKNKNRSTSCGKRNRNEVVVQKNSKTNIVHLKVEKEINNIFKNLPEDYEMIPEFHDKFELLMKNIYDIKDAIHKKTQNNFRPRKTRFEKNSH